MPGFQRIYSDEQRRGVVAWIVDGGHSAQQAVDAAKAGKLPGLESFSMTKSSAQHYAQVERRKRSADQRPVLAGADTEKAIAQVLNDAAKVYSRQHHWISNRAPGTTKGTVDLKTAREFVALGLDIVRLHRAAQEPKRAPGQRKNAARQGTQASSDGGGPLLQQLAREERARQKTARATHQTDNTEDGLPATLGLGSDGDVSGNGNGDGRAAGFLAQRRSAARAALPGEEGPESGPPTR